MADKKSILVVDEDPRQSRPIFTALVRAGHSVTDAQKTDFALDLLRDRSFEVAVIDITRPDSETDRLIQSLKDDWTKPLIIAVADFPYFVKANSRISRGPRHFLSKPVGLDSLVDKVEAWDAQSPPPRGADLSELLCRLSESGKSAVLEVHGGSDLSVRLFLHDNRLVHASSTSNEGDLALQEALTLDDGSFSIGPWIEPIRITMDLTVAAMPAGSARS